MSAACLQSLFLSLLGGYTLETLEARDEETNLISLSRSEFALAHHITPNACARPSPCPHLTCAQPVEMLTLLANRYLHVLRELSSTWEEHLACDVREQRWVTGCAFKDCDLLEIVGYSLSVVMAVTANGGHLIVVTHPACRATARLSFALSACAVEDETTTDRYVRSGIGCST